MKLIGFLRAALVAGVALLIFVGGSARAAEPSPSADTLGASVQSQVFVKEDRSITFKNLSTVAAIFTFTPAGEWTLDRTSIVLDPGDTGHVVVMGDGEDNASIGVNVTSAGEITPGTTRTALAFQARIAHERPFDPAPWIYRALVGALIAAFIVIVLAKTKPWTLRLSRAA